MRCAAFLRGINLGRRRVRKPELCATFERADLTEVDTFLASGNVVFTAPGEPDLDALTARIETALEADLGYPVTTFLRTEAALAAVLDGVPFPPAELASSDGKLQIILLRQAPTPEQVAAAAALAPAEDRLVCAGPTAYWLPAGPLSASGLDTGALDRLLGPTTIRTVNTLVRFQAKYFAATGTR